MIRRTTLALGVATVLLLGACSSGDDTAELSVDSRTAAERDGSPDTTTGEGTDDAGPPVDGCVEVDEDGNVSIDGTDASIDVSDGGLSIESADGSIVIDGGGVSIGGADGSVQIDDDGISISGDGHSLVIDRDGSVSYDGDNDAEITVGSGDEQRVLRIDGNRDGDCDDLDDDSDSDGASGQAEDQEIACTGADNVEVDGQGRDVEITGTCASVDISGQGNKVDIEDVGVVHVDGQGHKVEIGGSVTQISLSGQGHDVEYPGNPSIDDNSIGSDLD